MKMRTTKRPKIIPLRARLSLAARQKGSPDNPVHIRDPELGKWTSRLVVWTCALVLTAVVSAAISFFTLRSINGQLNEMQAEQRPWVYVTDFNLASPLTVDNGKLKFRVNYTAKNVGKSTATDVRPNAILILTWINSKSGLISSAGDSSFHAVEPWKIYENQNFETRADNFVISKKLSEALTQQEQTPTTLASVMLSFPTKPTPTELI
jgi:hypothetical protein